MTNTDLFSKLLKGPYSHFKKVGEDDWRDIGTRNPGFSISSKGYFNHNSGSKGSLSDLCKEHKLISAGNLNSDNNKKELVNVHKRENYVKLFVKENHPTYYDNIVVYKSPSPKNEEFKLPIQYIYSKTNLSPEEKKRWDENKK